MEFPSNQQALIPDSTEFQDHSPPSQNNTSTISSQSSVEFCSPENERNSWYLNR
jgi:hypothetical protein